MATKKAAPKPSVSKPTNGSASYQINSAGKPSAYLSWANNCKNGGAYTSHSIWRQIDTGAWSRVASLSPSATSCTVTISEGHTYKFQLRTTGGGSSWTTSLGSVKVPKEAPTGLKSQVVSHASRAPVFKLTWKNATVYSRIEVGINFLNNEGNWDYFLIGSYGGSTASADTSASNPLNTMWGQYSRYYFELVAHKGSEKYRVRSQVEKVPKVAPVSSLKAVLSSMDAGKGTGEAVLSWQNVASDVKYDNVYVYSVPKSLYPYDNYADLGPLTRVASLSGSSTSWKFPVSAGQERLFCVLPYSKTAGYPITPDGYLMTRNAKLAVGRPSAPAAVTGLKVSLNAATNMPHLSWKNNSTVLRPYDGIYVFIREKINGGAWGSWTRKASVSKDADSWTHEDAEGNHTYQYRLVAHNDLGQSSPTDSAQVVVKTLRRTKPVTGLKAVVSDGPQVSVTWNNVSGSPEQTYGKVRVERRVDKKGSWAELSESVSTSYTDTAVSRGHTYEYRVTAWSENGGDSETRSTSVVVSSMGKPNQVSALKPAWSWALAGFHVSFKVSNTFAHPVSKITFRRRQNDGETWSEWKDISTWSSGDEYFVDADVVYGMSYQYMAVPENAAGVGVSVASAVVKRPPSKPSMPVSLTASFEDGRFKLAWSPRDTLGAPYDKVHVEYDTNSRGQWTQALVLDAKGGQSSCSVPFSVPDRKVSFRIRAKNDAGYSEWSNVAVAYTIPKRPGSLHASMTADKQVLLKMTGMSAVATKMLVQRSTDGETWQDAALVAKANQHIDDAAGELYYRVACVMPDGTRSAWSDVAYVAFLAPPLPPTIVNPAPGAAIVPTLQPDGSYKPIIDIEWKHNPRDGSEQTHAFVEFQVKSMMADGQTVDGFRYLEVEDALDSRDAQRVQIDLSLYSSTVPFLDFVRWDGYYDVSISVRTMGAYMESTSEPSVVTSLRYLQYPQIAIVQPEPVVRELPMRVDSQFYDKMGELADMRMSIRRAGGEEVFSLPMGVETSALIDRTMWAPDDETDYVLEMQARSSTSVTGVAQLPFRTDLTPPDRASLHIEVDRDRGWARLKCVVDDLYHGVPIETCDLWRVVDGKETLLASMLAPGQEYLDKYAPLNKPYAYKVVSMAASGAFHSVLHPGSIKTPYAFIYYGGHGADEMARGMWDPTESVSISKPGRELVNYAGRESPVEYDDGSVDEKRSVSWFVDDEAEAMALMEAVRVGGCVYKSHDGAVFHCAIEADVSKQLTTRSGFGTMSASLTKVEGVAL